MAATVRLAALILTLHVLLATTAPHPLPYCNALLALIVQVEALLLSAAHRARIVGSAALWLYHALLATTVRGPISNCNALLALIVQVEVLPASPARWAEPIVLLAAQHLVALYVWPATTAPHPPPKCSAQLALIVQAEALL